jgi:hypothetical protein
MENVLGAVSGQQNEFKEIKTGKDADEFLGQIVAFETNNGYFARMDNTWQRAGKPGIYFGYVSKNVFPWNSIDKDNTGPNMDTVLKPDSVPSNNALISETINGRGDHNPPLFLKMRLATAEEISGIIEAVTQRQANLEYDFGNGPFSKALHKAHGDALGEGAKRSFGQRVTEAFKNKR